ncbi:MAG: hypothetical protein ACOVNU_10660 [Candidatus Kapaibacteriota bacterium]
MSNSNLIQFQKITQPENLNFVFPLSRYNQEINGLKNNFYSLEVSLSYDIKNVFPVNNISIRPSLGYQYFLGSIYKEEMWKITGFNFSLGFNYLLNDNNSSQNNDKNNKPFAITDTVIIRDTIYKELKIDKSKLSNSNFSDFNNNDEITLVSSDTTINSKSNLDYTLDIITIKETYELTNVTFKEEEKTNFELIIPNLDIKYVQNGNLIDKYSGKVEKELYDYTLVKVDCNDIRNNLINNKIPEANPNLTNIIKDTIYTYNYPTFNFNLDIFSEEEIKQSKLILNGFIENETKLIYSDTITFLGKAGNTKYVLDINHFIDVEKLNLNYNNSKFKTNTNLKDFTINYNLLIEDINANIDSTISGEILLNNIEDKPKKANKEALYIIPADCFNAVGENKDNRDFADSLKKINLIKLELAPQFLSKKDKYYIKK